MQFANYGELRDEAWTFILKDVVKFTRRVEGRRLWGVLVEDLALPSVPSSSELQPACAK